MKSVLVSEDHAIVRFGITAIIRDILDPVKVVEAADFDETIRQLSEQTFDLLILDINIPGGNNLQMISAVRLRQPGIRILIFSGYDEQMFGINYIQAGADGYLEKHAPEEEIRRAILTMSENGKYLTPGIRTRLLDHHSHHGHPSSPESANPLMALSGREKEVMLLLAKGMSVMNIARALNIQVTTVSTYKSRIFEKLNINSVIGLAEMLRLYSN
ncbi:response regulator transcription factor [Chitinophaga sp.]|uniref:response regulator n=1 Tax=Chitinophaga sp. TaxID=1869181 RepID=UPI00262E654B|nr:response regulator transcription factor [uncultured Chitinophaga sp.]